MKAMVDERVCAGTGLCAETCPEVFEVVDGRARVKVEVVPTETEDACREAVGNCPTEAISVED